MVPAAYLVSFLLAVAAGIFTSMQGIAFANTLPRGSAMEWVVGAAANWLPALFGFVAYIVLSLVFGRQGKLQNGFRAHGLRCIGPYLVLVAASLLVLWLGSNPDFWLVGQLIIWPGLAAVGAVLADALGAFTRHRLTSNAV